jgi:RNA polymerase II C-terminal domain phosphatase-like 3/4
LNRDSAGATDVNRRANFSDLKDGNLGGASVGNRKHKAVDDPQVDENALKRFRGGTANPRDMQPTGNPNQLMNIRAPTNSSGINMKTLQPPQTTAPHASAGPAVPLPSMLLKDIAVNPTLLMHLIQMEHQKKSASETQGGMSSGMTNNGITGTVFTPGNAPKTTEAAQVPSVRPQVPVQTPPLVKLFVLLSVFC